MTRFAISLGVSISLLLGGIQLAQCQKPSSSQKEVPKNHWPNIERLAKSEDYTQAAKLAVEELERDYPDRQYAMWKWWESRFGHRKDYMEMSRKFGDGLFGMYDQASPARRRVIAEIFGRPQFDVSKSAVDLRLAVEKKN